ncbi:hypothetical protein HY623_02675 [Candidatus Uhrbacteria bacterium]|nr:hypothetical protein [Candidatus Uhrbacteria bacterium]
MPFRFTEADVALARDVFPYYRIGEGDEKMAKITTGQIAELIAQSDAGRITRAMMARFLRSPTLLDPWGEFYEKEFGLAVNLAEKNIPPQPDQGKWRLLVIASGVTIEGAYQQCKTAFGSWKYTETSLDEVIIQNERDTSNGSYAIWVRDGAEADEELKNTSADQIAERGITTETLLECLIHNLAFFRETGKRLDVVNVTLCAGSRLSDGNVPSVDTRSDGKLRVHWIRPGDALVHLRARQAVSL